MMIEVWSIDLGPRFTRIRNLVQILKRIGGREEEGLLGAPAHRISMKQSLIYNKETWSCGRAFGLHGYGWRSLCVKLGQATQVYHVLHHAG